MIKTVKISNFRGLAGVEREFEIGRASLMKRGCVTSVVGPSASGKSTLLAALELLQTVARGVRSVGFLHHGELTALSADFDKPCDVVVSFVLSGITYQYGLRLVCNAQAHLWQIENEWLSVGRDDESLLMPVFVRTGARVEVGDVKTGGGSYDLDPKVFVLSTFVTPDRMHPLFRTKAYFANLFIFGDKIGFLNDSIMRQNQPVYLCPHAENLGAWLSFQMNNRADFYRVLAEVLQRYLSHFVRFVVLRENPSVSRLSAFFSSARSGEAGRAVPLWMLSSTERSIFLGALMIAVGRVFRPADLLCDDFDFIEEACPPLASEIGRVYSENGHLVAFHKKNRKLYQDVSISLVKEISGDVSSQINLH